MKNKLKYKKQIDSEQRGIKFGYRSGLEKTIAQQIRERGLQVQYETEKIMYSIHTSSHTYTPDFKIPTQRGFFYVESKGRMTLEDRKKHILIKTQFPEIDLRFVFSNSKQKLYKGSPTSYADWCVKHQFQYADKAIPEEWLSEK